MANYLPFDAAINDLWQARHNYLTDTYMVAFYPSATAFSVTDVNHAYGDYANEAVGGNIPAGGLTLDNFLVTNGNADFDDETILGDPANPAAVRTILIYNDTVVGKFGIGFVTYGADQSLVPGGLIQPNAAGFTLLETTPDA